MLIRTFAAVLVISASFILVTGQRPDAKKEEADRATKTNSGIRQRDVPFVGGVDLQYLIRDLAKDMDLNVLLDPESRLDGRKIRIEIRNVTSWEALNYILVQERLYFEEVGPRTILVASQVRGTSIPQLRVAVHSMSDQLAQYFGVAGGTLINHVPPDSPGSKAGLKAGDVIIGIDGEPVLGPVGLIRAIDQKKDGVYTLVIVRNRTQGTLKVNP